MICWQSPIHSIRQVQAGEVGYARCAMHCGIIPSFYNISAVVYTISGNGRTGLGKCERQRQSQWQRGGMERSVGCTWLGDLSRYRAFAFALSGSLLSTVFCARSAPFSTFASLSIAPVHRIDNKLDKVYHVEVLCKSTKSQWILGIFCR